jgi:signal transduction histidine kinase
MIKRRLFRDYFLLASVILILTIFLGIFISRFVAESFKPELTQRQVMPPLFLAKTIDNLNYPSKLESIRAMESFHDQPQGPKPSLVLINSDLEILFSSGDVAQAELPSVDDLNSLIQDYDFKYYGEKEEHTPPPLGFGPGPGGPGGPGLGAPPPGGGGPGGPVGGPPMPRQKAVIKLKDVIADAKKYYLLVMPPKMMEPQGMARLMPILGIGSVVLSLLIGVGITIFVIYLSVRKKVLEADTVISELHKGNLKARFAVGRDDEFGQAMMRFNKMAEEIEHLVNHLKNVEVSRRKLLQELAHDLRTPIASLKTLIETLDENQTKLDSKTKAELLSLSSKEVNYFARLVEDLLILSQVDEPKYSVHNSGVAIGQLLQDEIYDIELKNPTKNIHFKSDFAEGLPLVQGDAKLLKRMVRNGLENSVSFSHKELWIILSDLGDGGYGITITDDGPGFRSEELSHFGERRLTRQLSEGAQGGRVSVGLGSVIMKKICEVHGGQLKAANRINESGSVTGATVSFEFSSLLLNLKS